MSFINTWALIGLIGVPILILIYIIRHRYREEVVPSTFLWKRSLKYMKRRLPFNLKNIILLLLQITAVTLAVLVIARPTIPSEDTGEIIAIIDASASMMTTDLNGRSRLDRAKMEVARLAETADEHNPMTVIKAGESARKVLDRSGERLAIVNSLDRISCDWGEVDAAGALEIAQEVRKNNVGARILFYTDTVYETVENIETVLVTDNEWNAAALNLTVEQQTNGAFGFTGEVASYGKDATINAVLYVDGEYVQAKKVDCVNGEPVTVQFREYAAVNYTHAEMRLDIPEEGDAFAHDDQFFVHQTETTRNRVEVVFAPGYKDEFLTIALSAARINYQVVQIDSVNEDGYEDRENATGGYNPSKIKYSGYSAYIFVGIVPEQIPSDGTSWLMNPPHIPEELGVTAGSKQSDPQKHGYPLIPVISATEEESAILSGITLVDNSADVTDNAVKVLTYCPLTVNKREGGSENETESDYVYKTLLSCERNAEMNDVFIVGKNDKNHTRVIISTLVSSNLTASLEYTLLVDNLIEYACPETFETGNRIVGEQADLTLPAGTIGVEIIRDNVTISLIGKRDYHATGESVPSDMTVSFSEPGDYTVRLHIAYVDQYGELSSSTQKDFCSYVSVSETESNSYQTLPELMAVVPEDGIRITVPVEIWFYLLIALLVVLMAEWWVYHHA